MDCRVKPGNDEAAMTNLPALLPALPEIFLALGAIALIIYGAFAGERTANTINWVAFGLLIVTGLIVYCLPSGKLFTFGGGFIVDDFARVLKILALVGSAVTIVLARDYFAAERTSKFEFGILILLSTTGMMMLISAADLIALYLGLELM